MNITKNKLPRKFVKTEVVLQKDDFRVNHSI
jgi:hypothetical protein